MQERPTLHVMPPPTFVKRMKDEARGIERAGLEQILEDIPQPDIDRLKQQLTPLLSRAPVFPDDRDATTRLMQEWQMRGLPVPAFNAVYDLLWEDHRAERQAASASMRGHFEQEYAPWFLPDAKPKNPGLGLVPRSTREAGEAIAAFVDDTLHHVFAGEQPGRPTSKTSSTSTVTAALSAFLRGTAPRR